jgi:general stress protein CsbA
VWCGGVEAVWIAVVVGACEVAWNSFFVCSVEGPVLGPVVALARLVFARSVAVVVGLALLVAGVVIGGYACVFVVVFVFVFVGGVGLIGLPVPCRFGFGLWVFENTLDLDFFA